MLALYSFLALGSHFGSAVSGENNQFSPDEVRTYTAAISTSAGRTLIDKISVVVIAVHNQIGSKPEMNILEDPASSDGGHHYREIAGTCVSLPGKAVSQMFGRKYLISQSDTSREAIISICERRSRPILLILVSGFSAGFGAASVWREAPHLATRALDHAVRKERAPGGGRGCTSRPTHGGDHIKLLLEKL
jgi:hypothetical protein